MNAFVANIFKFKKIIAVVIAVVSYFVLTYATNEQQIAFEKEVIALDVNKDGIYSDDEVNEEQKQIIEKMQNGTAGQIAPFSLLIFALFFGLFIFFLIQAIENFTLKKGENTSKPS